MHVENPGQLGPLREAPQREKWVSCSGDAEADGRCSSHTRKVTSLGDSSESPTEERQAGSSVPADSAESVASGSRAGFIHSSLRPVRVHTTDSAGVLGVHPETDLQ